MQSIEVHKTPNTSTLRETLELQHKWHNFPDLCNGWNVGFKEISKMVKHKKNSSKINHKILAQFLAFTIALKLPPMRTQNLTFIIYSSEIEIQKKIGINFIF